MAYPILEKEKNNNSDQKSFVYIVASLYSFWYCLIPFFHAHTLVTRMYKKITYKKYMGDTSDKDWHWLYM